MNWFDPKLNISRSSEVWSDNDADGLREYVRKEWPQLADELDLESGLVKLDGDEDES